MTKTRQNTPTSQDRDKLVALEQAQLLRWQFTAFNVQESLGQLSDDEQALSYPMLIHGGPQGLALQPHLIAYLRQAAGWSKPCLRADISKNRIGIGGALVLINPTEVPFDELDALTTSELLIVPHLSATVPNGVWRIDRGDLHPLVLAVAQLKVWTLAGTEGHPDFYYHLGKDDPVDASSARGVDLFTTLQAAQDSIAQSKAEGEPELGILEFMPRQILDCLARTDVACIDLNDYSISHRGMVALGRNDTASTATLLHALAGKAQL